MVGFLPLAPHHDNYNIYIIYIQCKRGENRRCYNMLEQVIHGDGSVSQMGKLRSEVLIHLDKWLTIQQTQVRQQSCDKLLRTIAFLGPSVSIDLIHACSKTLVTWIYIYWGFCSCVFWKESDNTSCWKAHSCQVLYTAWMQVVHEHCWSEWDVKNTHFHFQTRMSMKPQ